MAAGSPTIAVSHFDAGDGVAFIEDAEGVDLAGSEAGRRQARAAPAGMARDGVPGDGSRGTATVRARDRAGRIGPGAAPVPVAEIDLREARPRSASAT